MYVAFLSVSDVENVPKDCRNGEGRGAGGAGAGRALKEFQEELEIREEVG